MSVYRSNLTAPDLRGYFKLLDPPMQHCGHDAPSDPDFDPKCGFWTVDEAAILYNVADPMLRCVDVGARFGWTAAHLMAAGCGVTLVDPELANPPQARRMAENLKDFWDGVDRVITQPFSEALLAVHYDGFVIDGCHDAPEPLCDAQKAMAHAAPDCIIMFHDTLGTAVRDGVRFLMDNGWRCRMYWTPNGVACCWRGHEGWMPPDHVPDPEMDFAPHKAMMTDMKDYWRRCE